MEEKIKEFRLEIDRIINSGIYLNPTRETALCYTQLQRGKMWLGKMLGQMNSPDPYPQSTNPESPVIEPMAEHTETVLDLTGIETNQLARVKFFRAAIKGFLKVWDDTSEDITNHFRELSGEQAWKPLLFHDQAYLCIHEAVMWLGMELDSIRNRDLLGDIKQETKDIIPWK